jgi:hypothetical protein
MPGGEVRQRDDLLDGGARRPVDVQRKCRHRSAGGAGGSACSAARGRGGDRRGVLGADTNTAASAAVPHVSNCCTACWEFIPHNTRRHEQIAQQSIAWRPGRWLIIRRRSYSSSSSSDPVRLRLQDQLCRGRATFAIHGHDLLATPITTCSLRSPWQLLHLLTDQVYGWPTPVLAAHGLLLDPDLSAHRLSDGLCHSTRPSQRRTCCCW